MDVARDRVPGFHRLLIADQDRQRVGGGGAGWGSRRRAAGLGA